MTTSVVPSYAGYRFPAEIISHAVWLYLDDGKDSCGILIQEPLTRLLGLADGRRQADRTAAARVVC